MKYWRRPGHVGRVKTRLAAALLAQLGIKIEPENLWSQKGFYRSHFHDLARWGGNDCYWDEPHAVLYGHKKSFSISSWDTMTECVSKGLAMVGDPFRERSVIEVCVND